MTNVNLNKLPQRGAALMGALADPTRKTIFNMLIEQPLVVKVIAADLPISQSAVSQHLKVMKVSGLVLEKKQGRTHLYSANPEALDWLSWQFSDAGVPVAYFACDRGQCSWGGGNVYCSWCGDQVG